MYRRVGHFLQFLAIFFISAPFRFLPFSVIRLCGNALGRILYFFLTKFRKRTLSNLALAEDLHLSSADTRRIAIESFQNLCITVLEYAKFAQVKNLKKYVVCENPEVPLKLMDQGHGVLFFCAHQANWEVLFLDGTTRMPGVAIGRPIKNPYLYKWIVSIRQRFGGKIIPPKRAVWEGMRALKQKKFLGIVGDQGMPSSSFESSFLGRRAYTSTIPALLAYKSKAALLTALIWRTKQGYRIRYTEPKFADTSKPLEEEVDRLMHLCLHEVEESIRMRPGEWLWQHNRWKQETPHAIYYRFRHETMLITANSSTPISILRLFRTIYPKSFLSYLVPEERKSEVEGFADDVMTYTDEVPLITDYRFKMVFDLTDSRIFDRFRSLAAFDVFRKKDLEKLCSVPYSDFSDLIIKTICRKGAVPYAY